MSRCIYTHTGVRRTPVGSSLAYMPVCISVCMSVHLSFCLSFWSSTSILGDQIARPVITCSACSRYMYRGGGDISYTKIKTLNVTPSDINYVYVCISIRPSVCLYLCLSVQFSASLFGDKIVRPVIAQK